MCFHSPTRPTSKCDSDMGCVRGSLAGEIVDTDGNYVGEH